MNLQLQPGLVKIRYALGNRILDPMHAVNHRIY